MLAEDSVLLREGVARLLRDAGFEVVGQASNADELLLKVRSYSPDIAIVDVRMPPGNADDGLVAAAGIRRTHPSVAVLSDVIFFWSIAVASNIYRQAMDVNVLVGVLVTFLVALVTLFADALGSDLLRAALH